MAGGSTIIHFVIGPGGLVIFCLGILAHIKLFNLIMKPTENEYRAFMEERTHSATINNDVRSLWLQTNSEESFDKDDEIESARAAFNALDHDNSGTLDVSEIQDLLESWHATPHVMQAFLNRFENSKGICVFQALALFLQDFFVVCINLVGIKILNSLTSSFDLILTDR